MGVCVCFVVLCSTLCMCSNLLKVIPHQSLSSVDLSAMFPAHKLCIKAAMTSVIGVNRAGATVPECPFSNQ
jgi:hypothetical protein